MTAPAARRTSQSTRIAILVVDAFWYISWAVTILAVALALVVWVFPQARDTLVTRGIARAETTFDVPLEIRYPVNIPPPSGTRELVIPAQRIVLQRPVRVFGYNDVVFAKPFDRHDVAFYVLYRLAIAAVFLWTLFQLRALMHAVGRGHPFDPRNSARIRRIGWVLIAAGFVGDIARPLWVGASFNTVVPLVKQALPGASVAYRLTLSWELILVGLIVLAIAQAFDAGARLQDDHDLTV